LERAGLDVERYDVEPGRPNVIATRRGTGRGRRLILNSHIDTVGVGDMPDGHRPRVRDGVMFGRGACDTKAGLAAAMIAMARAPALRGDVILTAVADEEHSSIGSAAVARTLTADAAIVLEPTSLGIRHTHKGFAWIKVDVHGRASHGSRPDLGVDAIAQMGSVLSGLAELEDELLQRPAHPELGTPSIHAGTITGGQDVASYPGRCSLAIERRVLPGEGRETAIAELERVLTRARQRHPGLDVRARLTTFRSPLDVDPQLPIIRLLVEAIGECTGTAAKLSGSGGWTDAALLSQAGIPAAVFGPHGGDLHAPGEWVDLESVVTALAVLERVIARFCA
jgi:acetylornithine deacetylase